MKLLRSKRTNPGDKTPISDEPIIEDFGFNVFKFSDRPKPEKEKVLIVGCFSEFGCEIVGAMYCIPRLKAQYPDRYIIVAGWFGREYLYRHLVDEFWEIHEEHMWLREYARAFHNESKNLRQIEKNLGKSGAIIPSHFLGTMSVGATCNSCHAVWGDLTIIEKCKQCSSTDISQSLFADASNHKKNAVLIPTPSVDKLNYVKKYLGPNPVGIFARNRKCYGRNLQPDFYINLIALLESQGYTPIWLGEKQSTLECPVDHIVDFSRMEESRDLELTLAIIKQLKFTIQFWTASSRLAALMGTPYILFESPDQIWGNGQEGYRLNLTAFGPRKLVISHYLNVYNDNAAALNLVTQAIEEINAENYEEIFGLLESEQIARHMRSSNIKRLGE